MIKIKDNSMKNKVTEKLNIILLKCVGACEGHLWGVMFGNSKVIK